MKDPKLERMTKCEYQGRRKKRERSVSSPQNVLVCVAAAGSVFLALISARPGQEYLLIWSQIFRLLKVRLIRLIRRLKKSLKSGQITCKS